MSVVRPGRTDRNNEAPRRAYMTSVTKVCRQPAEGLQALPSEGGCAGSTPAGLTMFAAGSSTDRAPSFYLGGCRFKSDPVVHACARGDVAQFGRAHGSDP